MRPTRAQAAERGQTTAMAVFETYDDSVQTVEKPFGLALVELARQRPDIVGLSADLAQYTDIDLFAREYPERFFQIGMAEQNLRSGLRTGASGIHCVRNHILRFRNTPGL